MSQNPPQSSPRQQRPGQPWRRHPLLRAQFWHSAAGHGLELVALILALVLALAGGLAWRLAQGPVSLDFLRDDAQSALQQVFAGSSAHIGALQADWSAQERAIVIAARDVKIVDAKGRVLVQTPQFDVGLSALGLLQGKAVLRRLTAIGGEFSFVRRANGTVGGGLGAPDQVSPMLPGSSSKASLQSGSLAGILGRLQVLAMRGAVLHFRDERSGINWVAPHANVRFVRRGDRIIASADGTIKSASGTASLSMNAFSRTDFSHMSAELTLSNAVPAALLPQTEGPWRWIKGLDASLGAQISFTTGGDGLLRTADGRIRIGQGFWRHQKQQVAIDSADIVFAFDPINGAVNIALARLQSNALSGVLKGSLSGLDPARLAIGEKVGFDLAFENMMLAPTDVFARPLAIKQLKLDGAFLPAQGRAVVDRFRLDYAGLALRGHAALDLPGYGRAADAPLFSLSARSDGAISPAGILALWPVRLAEGGRVWIANNVLDARLHDFVMDVRLPQRVLGAPHLDNNMLTLSFAFDGGRSHFVHAMTPVRDGEGTGVLRGNRFDLLMTRAKLMNTELTMGYVRIPRLRPKGVTGHFGAHADGPLNDVVTLLDEQPLGFISRYGVSPAKIKGTGAVDFAIDRPMRVEVPVRQIGFSASGAYKNIRVKGLVAGKDIADASAKFSAGPKGLIVVGDGKIGPVPGKFTWQERFFAQNEPRTTLDIDTVIDSQVFDGLGIPTRLFLDGPLALHMHSIGDGLDVASADVTADLTQARLMSPGAQWEKPAGQPGTAGFTIKRRPDGGYDINGLEASTQGFVVKADFSIAPKGGMQSAHIRRASMEGLFDFSADVKRGPAGAFILNGKAKSLDARGFVRGLVRGVSNNIDLGLRARINFERALVSDEMTLKNGMLDFNKTPQQIESMKFRAETPDGIANITIADDELGKHRIIAQTDNAGLVIQALFGPGSVHGGHLQIDGVLGDGKAQNTKIDLSMTDFQLGNVPVMAKILSLGSLTGIADSMNGEGLGFKKLIAPLEFDHGIMKIGKARATGPALGVTVSGKVDMAGKTMALSGALAPAYTLNSALGNIPILGDVLISRKGEGLFGLSYRVKGPFDALEVVVNPLSALTPGVLRRIFEGGPSDTGAKDKIRKDNGEGEKSVPADNTKASGAKVMDLEPATKPEPEKSVPKQDP